ncbi:MAG: GDSL-type esterase/lipase family protein [Verrucomicrobiae bacterium]
MIAHDQLAFHNVAELAPAPGGGLHLARFPKRAWSPIDSSCGDMTVRSSNGCEIRFVTDAPRVRIYLRSLHGHADLVHLRGNHISCYERIEAGQLACLQLELPPMEPNRSIAARAAGGFAPQVYRIYSCAAPLAYHGADAMGGAVRPPAPEELPRRRWLAYGSSITQGGATYHNYVNAAAQMLEANVCNLGMGGSCFIEPQIADFIAGRDDWDFASFELGVNMVSPARDNARFAEKVNYLLERVTSRHPGKPIFLITIFDLGVFHEKEASDWQRDARDKNDILRAAAARFSKQVNLLDGQALVPDFRGFQTDLLHPEPFAAARIGLALAEAMEPALANLPVSGLAMP